MALFTVYSVPCPPMCFKSRNTCLKCTLCMLVALVMVCMLSTFAITYLMSTVTIHGGSDVRPPLSERDKMRGCKTVLKCLKEIHGVELDLEECFEILERVHEGVEKEPELWSKKKMPSCILSNLNYANIEYMNSLRKE